MAPNPYMSLMQTYFPKEEWDRANCIANSECNPSAVGYPNGCISDEGNINCGAGARLSHAYGVFKLLDSCWDPEMNPTSPFTPEQWAKVIDPNYNTWMASVIWSRYGWRAWTTCETCAACDIPGGPIPHPRGPVEAGEAAGINWLLILGAAAVVGVGVVAANRKK